MREPIEVNYVPDGDDWQVTITGRGQKREITAVGLVEARDQADQAVAELAPDEEHRTVVHLLNGDALAFTSAYLSARLARPGAGPDSADPATGAEPPPGSPAGSENAPGPEDAVTTAEAQGQPESTAEANEPASQPR